MSDNEGATKKSGYRLEYASSARAKCKGARPCTGTQIPKGALRVGSIVDFRGNTTFAWRHWGCTTPRIITNMKAKFSTPADLDGFEDLNEEDKERVGRAWEEGHVADEDIPPTARKPADATEEEEEKPKKKRAPAKKKVEAEGDEEEKPKRKRATKPKKIEDDGEDEAEAEAVKDKPKSAPVKKSRAKKREGEEGTEKPKATRRRTARKTVAVEKAAKYESEGSGEDFAGEMAEVEDDDDEDADDSAGKKRKRTVSTKQAAPAKKPRATSSRAKKVKAVVEEYDDDM